MADYISQYTGGQIDSAVGRALPGGALEALIAEKAPKGFGYGEELEYIGIADASETMETYCAKLDAVIAKMPNSSAKQIAATPPGTYGAGRYIATIYKYFNDFAVVVGFSSPNAAQYSFGWRIVKNTNVWYPLEWDNPPMQLGVEYRTTERYLGKPVYARVVDCGAVVANSPKTITVIPEKEGDPSNAGQIVSYTVEMGTGNSFPARSEAGAFDQVHPTIIDRQLKVYVEMTASTSSLRCTVKYTKTTD